MWAQDCRLRGTLQVLAAEKQGSPTTTKKRTTGPPILPPINDNVSWLFFPPRCQLQLIMMHLAVQPPLCICFLPVRRAACMSCKHGVHIPCRAVSASGKEGN